MEEDFRNIGLKEAAQNHGLDDIFSRIRDLSTRQGVVDAESDQKMFALQRNMAHRFQLSYAVIIVYCVALVVIIGYIALYPVFADTPVKAMISKCQTVEECRVAHEAWKDGIGQLIDVLTIGVIPIVTLVLGYYFGVRQAGEAD